MRAVAIVLGALLVVTVYWWWQGRARPVVTIPPAAPASTQSPGQEVFVHVVGRVRRPGVVTLPLGSRVVDALEAAGGLRPGAQSGDLNLARILVDGEQVVVGASGTRNPDTPGASTSSGAPPGGSTPGAATPVPLDLNAASALELEGLPGVGPVLAGRIVAWREANGPFPSVDVLGEVPGIGDVVLANLRPLVRV